MGEAARRAREASRRGNCSLIVMGFPSSFAHTTVIEASCLVPQGGSSPRMRLNSPTPKLPAGVWRRSRDLWEAGEFGSLGVRWHAARRGAATTAARSRDLWEAVGSLGVREFGGIAPTDRRTDGVSRGHVTRRPPAAIWGGRSLSIPELLSYYCYGFSYSIRCLLIEDSCLAPQGVRRHGCG